MITARLTSSELDRFLMIASFVDDKLPKPSNNRQPLMFRFIDVSPDKNTYKDSTALPARPRIIPSSKQLTIYDFILMLLIDVEPKTRELLQLRNFPHRRSLRDMKRFYMDWSHTKIGYKYHRALIEVCGVANKNLKKYL